MRIGMRWTLILSALALLSAGCGYISIPPRPSTSYQVPSFPAGNPEAGAKLYATTCATCHGPTAQGVPGIAPSLRGRKAFGQLYQLEPQLAEFIYINMPKSNPGSLSSQQAADVASFIWGLNGHLGKSEETRLLASLGVTASSPSAAPSQTKTSTAPSSPSKTPSASVSAAEIAAGKQLFAQVCSVCHGTNGQGGIGPRLWGSGNLVVGGPYDTLSSLAGFIKSFMPAATTNGVAPGSLSQTQATDAAAYILYQNHQVK